LVSLRRTVVIRSLSFRTFAGSEFKQLIGSFVVYGFRFRAYRLLLNSFFLFKLKVARDPFRTFVLSFESLRPILGLRGKMIAGVFLKIPCLLSEARANAIACHWILKALRNTQHSLKEEVLATEFLGIFNLQGFAFSQLRSLYSEILDNASFLKFIRFRRRGSSRSRRRNTRRRPFKSRLFWGLKRKRKKR